jgi:hypothetical protein
MGLLVGYVTYSLFIALFLTLFLQVVAFVMDNATNNNTLVQHFASKCHSHNIPFSETNSCMRCLPHVIHLAALEVRLSNHSCKCC